MESKNEWTLVLEAKLVLLNRYDLLTDKIEEGFRKGDLEGVALPLSRREEIVRRIEKLDSSLRGKMSSSGIEGSEIGAHFRGIAESFHRKIRSVLEQIAQKEKDLIPVISKETEKLKSELLLIRESRCAAGKYTKPVTLPPRFVDSMK